MKSLVKLLRATAFRLALVFLALFALAAVAVIGYIYWNTNILLAQQLNETIEAEVRGLAEQYRSGGIVRLIGVVEARSTAPGNRLYAVSDFRGRKLAGNLNSAPENFAAEPGWIEFPYRRFQGGEATRHMALARTFRLPGGFGLLVGQDVEERRQFERVIRSALIWALGLTVAFGLGGGLLVSRRMLSRIDAMSDTSRRIMAGALSERIPTTGSGDELDRLAQSLNAMLDRIEKLMQGLKEVSDNIAHDLKTPLTRLRGRVEEALRGKTSSKAYREVLEYTLAESDNLISTFNALLSIARAEAGASPASLTDLDAVAILRDIAELYEPLAEEQGAAILLDLPEKAVFRGDRGLISQALSNLVDNALKYGRPDSGAAPEVTLSARSTAQGVELTVADRGPGVPPRDRERVTGRFVRLETSRSQPGSGLGLSLVAAITSLHGGRLRLDDNYPGLTATITIPSRPKLAAGRLNDKSAGRDTEKS